MSGATAKTGEEGKEGVKAKDSKKKKKKKDRKKDKDKKKKKGKKHKKKKKFHSSDSEDGEGSESSSSDSSAEWSIGDGKVDYGSPERLTDGSDQWEGRSIELYDSDNPPDCPLNTYHLQSRPRLLSL